jgi:hypothetical protein
MSQLLRARFLRPSASTWRLGDRYRPGWPVFGPAALPAARTVQRYSSSSHPSNPDRNPKDGGDGMSLVLFLLGSVPPAYWINDSLI